MIKRTQLSDEWCSKLLSTDFYIDDDNFIFQKNSIPIYNDLNNIVKYINNLNNSDFFNLIQYYKSKKDLITWNPFDIKKKLDFTKQIKQKDFIFTEIDIPLISKALNIDFIILDNTNYEIRNLSQYILQENIVVIYYDNINQIYKKIGILHQNKIQYIFSRKELPISLNIILDKHTFLLEHIKCVCENEIKCHKLHLNTIMKHIQDKIKTKLSIDDNVYLLKLIKVWLDNYKFFDN